MNRAEENRKDGQTRVPLERNDEDPFVDQKSDRGGREERKIRQNAQIHYEGFSKDQIKGDSSNHIYSIAQR
jgi:hypothetical protein